MKVWLPMRFSTLDADGVEAVRERVRLLLDRHRAAGVHVSVDYADPRWILGQGVVRDLTTAEAARRRRVRHHRRRTSNRPPT